MSERLNKPKKVTKKQKYEDYWKSTLALTNFFGVQFIRTLKVIVEHIDKYDLASKQPSELIQDLTKDRKKFNQSVAHSKELENLIFKLYPNDSKDGSSTRKQINTFVKLGFIKPYLKGYVPAAKEYIKTNRKQEELQRLFSDTVYQYSSFNSSQTEDNTDSNQIKFLVNTLLNKKNKKLKFEELLGIMQMDIRNHQYAKEKEILQNKQWASHIKFYSRKYNQLGHLKSILRSMNLFKVIDGGHNNFLVCLTENAGEFLQEQGNTARDAYRFGLMRKAVFEESYRVYGKKVSWYSKKEQEGLVVSHIYASADALKNWELDAAYDPYNALLLKPGDEDQYFDKYKMTFDKYGEPLFSNDVRKDFINESKKNDYKLDDAILVPERLYYISSYHNLKFKGYDID